MKLPLPALSISALVLTLGAVPLAAAPAHAADATTFYVSPAGSDTADGRSAGSAFATLPRAQEAVRAANAASDVTVVVGDGTFTLDEPLRFGVADGGQSGHAVTWRAADGATPVISGGREVEGWSDPDGDGIWQATLDSDFDFRQLYIDGTQAKRSEVEVDAGRFGWSRTGFSIDPNYLTGGIGAIWSKLKALPPEQQQRIELRSRASFTDRYAPFQSVQDAGAVMQQPAWDNNTWGWDTIDKPLEHRTLRIMNALPLVDTANEWYFDRDGHTLYYKPDNGVNPNGLDVVAPTLETLVSISGESVDARVSDLRFEGLSFRYASFVGPSSNEGFANQQNGTFISGRIYGLVDPQTRDLPTSDQRVFDGNEQAPLVPVIRQDDDGTYRYVDDGSAVASADLSRLINLRDYPTQPLNRDQLAAWNAAHANNQKTDCTIPRYPSQCIIFEAWRPHFHQMTASVQVSAAERVTFEGNEFSALGSVALGIGNDASATLSGVGLATKDVTVVDNEFRNIGATAVTAGGVSNEAHHPTSDAQANERLTVTDNRIHDIGTAYFDASALLVTYFDGATLAHNELAGGPYDAIDTGFGWGIPDAGGNSTYQGRGTYLFTTRHANDDPTIARNIHVEHNVMWDFKREGNDGGVLYHLGSAPGSTWDSNYLNGGPGTKLYFDEGTRYMTAKDNVIDPWWYWTFANGFTEGVPGPSANEPNSTKDNLVDGTVQLGAGINAGPWCYNSAACDPTAEGRWNNRITTRSQIGVNEYPLQAQRTIAEAGIRPQYRETGDRVTQTRGIDLTLSRDTSGAQIVTATAYNFGVNPLTDLAVQASASNGVTLTPLTTAPTSLAPGAQAASTWRVNGASGLTDGDITARHTSTRVEWNGTSRETVTRNLPVVLGGAVASDLTLAGFGTYLAPQAVQNGNDFAVQSMGRDIGVGGDEYTTVYRKDGLSTNGSITTKFTGAEGNFYKAGIAVRNDLSRTADATVPQKSTGYAALIIEPGLVGLRYDKDGDGVLETQVAQANLSTRPLWVRLTRDGNTLSGSYSTDGTTFTTLNATVPLTGADAGALDAGLVHSSANRTSNSGTDALSASTARFTGLSIVNLSRTPVFTSARPADGVVGKAYDFRFAATNEPTFSVTEGSLPAGLTLGSDGRLSGTPTAAGSFPVTVEAKNGTGTTTQSVRLIIRATAPASPSVEAIARSTAPGLATGAGVVRVTNPTDHANDYRVTVTNGGGAVVNEQTLATAAGATVTARVDGLGAGSYTVRVSGTDGSAPATATFSVTDGSFATVPAPWKSAGLGGASAAKRGVEGDQIAIVGGKSSDISGENNPRTDSFNTVYRENVLPANGVVQVTVTGQDAVSDFTKSGLVVRDDLSVSTAGSRASGEAALVLTPTRGVRFTVENEGAAWFPIEAGESTAWNVRQVIPAPVTLRLERKDGTTLVASYSTDGGATFATIGTKTGFFTGGADTTLDAGVVHATNGGVNGTAGSAAFRSFTVGANTSDTVKVQYTAEARCVAGKVQLAVKAVNTGDTTASLAISTLYGSKTTTVAAGATATAVFAARSASVPAGESTVAVTQGTALGTLTTSYAGRSCG